MKKESITISFRIGQELGHSMDKAREQFGYSRGEFARWALVDRVESETQVQFGIRLDVLADRAASLIEELGQVKTTQSQLLQVLRRLAFTLLSVSPPMPSEQAKQLVRQIFEE